MDWNDLQNNQMVSFNAAKSGPFNQKMELPDSNKLMTKEEAIKYLDIEISYLDDLEDNRCVWKSRLVAKI